MEIGSFGSINLDDYRPSSPAAVYNSQNKDFAGLVDRIRSSENAGENSPGQNAAEFSAQGGIDKNDKLYQLCLELETFLVKNLLTGMRNTVQKSGFIDEGFAGKMYEDMLYDEYAKDFTKNASFGLAEQAYKQLKYL